MAYKCPKCGDVVHRSYRSSAQVAAGLAGALFYMALVSSNAKNVGRYYDMNFHPKIELI